MTQLLYALAMTPAEVTALRSKTAVKAWNTAQMRVRDEAPMIDNAVAIISSTIVVEQMPYRGIE